MIKTMRKLFAVACLTALTTGAQAQNKLPGEFNELPMFIQREVKGIRARCSDAEVWPMAGISTFWLDGPHWSAAILVDDQHVCRSANHGENCHTWGCDVRVYRQTGKSWEKILDEPAGGLFLSTEYDGRFILAALSFTYKYEEKCGEGSMSSGHGCDFLLTWGSGKWHWQKLQKGTAP